jgi:hypothetical protein
MKLSPAIFTLPLTLLMVSCDQEVYYNTPKDKLPIWSNEEILRFEETKSGFIDSMKVKVSFDSEVSDKRYHYQYLILDYIPISTRLMDYKLRVFEGYNSLTISNSDQNEYFIPIKFGNNTSRLNQSYFLGNIKLNEVYKVYRDSIPDPRFYGDPTPVDHATATDIVEIYYSPQYGVLQFKLMNGEIVKLTLN